MIRGDEETELYSGVAGFGDTQIWHYSGGVEYMFTDKGLTDWRLSGYADLGASSVTFDTATEYRETYLSLNYGEE
ncbi:hypothetical protein QYS49_10435 [Marivirga salinae]|uniref:Uncharacterized protein n=1 Tax=Marivirga salinarum TaxID=3059078 RepID=A0AA49GBK2_9BACT|nr:hypothetical protein [Marivirga sp. BDSF4-3]WKK77519.2 hypothetical protein QYS49_10435 [Marivirga sp. BDSF4-3]